MSYITPIQWYRRKENFMDDIKIFEYVFNNEDDYDDQYDDNRKELLESLAD